MLRSASDFHTLGSLLRVNQSFYRAYKNQSKHLLLSVAKSQYGELLIPMLDIAESIVTETGIMPPLAFQRSRHRPVFQRPRAPNPNPLVFNSLLIRTLFEIDSVLDTWLRIYEYRGPLGLLNYREMSSTPPSTLIL